MTEWLLVGLSLLLIAANALFVAAEFSFVTVDRPTVQRQAEAGDRRAASLLAGLRSLSTQLSGAQLGITVTSLLVGFIAEPSLAAILSGPLAATGLPDSAAFGVSITLALVAATCVQMVFGELVPKNWAIAEPLRVGRVVAGSQRMFTTATWPLIWLLNGSANRIVRLLGMEPTEELASARGPRELASLAGRSGSEGTLDPTTADLVSRSVGFGDRTAADVMTSRPRVSFLDSAQPVADVLAEVVASGHARYPVFGSSIDEVVGTVHYKHALAVAEAERDDRRIFDVMVPVRGVPETMRLDPLLEVLREPGLQLAVVVDEYGGTAGIVTLEDLVEEIVGEIDDEQDPPVSRLRQGTDGTWVLSGLLRPDEVTAATGLELPAPQDSDTLAGLLTELLGRLAEVGDTVDLSATYTDQRDEEGLPTSVDVILSVTRMDGRRIDGVELCRADASRGTSREQDGADHE